MVTLRHHPSVSSTDTSFLLDLVILTGNIPLDGFAVELLFRNERVEITDVQFTNDFSNNKCAAQKSIDNKRGSILFRCSSDEPRVFGPEAVVVATVSVRLKVAHDTKFSLGNRTQLYVHG